MSAHSSSSSSSNSSSSNSRTYIMKSKRGALVSPTQVPQGAAAAAAARDLRSDVMEEVEKEVILEGVVCEEEE